MPERIQQGKEETPTRWAPHHDGGQPRIAGSACALGQDASPSPSASPIDAGSSPEATAMVIAATGLTASQAIDIALGVIPGGVVVDIDQGWEQGRSYWDVVVRDPDGGAVEIYLDAATGDVLEQSPTRMPLLAVDGAPAITARQAIDTALEAVPGGTVIEADLDMEGGRLIWEILVRSTGGRSEVYVDAASGELLKVEDA